MAHISYGISVMAAGAADSAEDRPAAPVAATANADDAAYASPGSAGGTADGTPRSESRRRVVSASACTGALMAARVRADTMQGANTS